MVRIEMTEHAIAYRTRGETFIFVFSEGNDVLCVMAMAGHAANGDLDFNWADAMRCKQLVMEEVGDYATE